MGSTFGTGGLDARRDEGYLSSNGRCFDIGGTTRSQLDRFAATGEPFDPAPDPDVWALVAIVKEALGAEHRPDGFNIGVNVGAVAGQTVGHAHVHVIPRYSGDVADPRGGVRWVIPDKAAYWES